MRGSLKLMMPVTSRRYMYFLYLFFLMLLLTKWIKIKWPLSPDLCKNENFLSLFFQNFYQSSVVICKELLRISYIYDYIIAIWYFSYDPDFGKTLEHKILFFAAISNSSADWRTFHFLLTDIHNFVNLSLFAQQCFHECHYTVGFQDRAVSDPLRVSSNKRRTYTPYIYSMHILFTWSEGGF